jgi:catechol 2,3-dioxygenase-like lactoylglutathione lyase family enzyme
LSDFATPNLPSRDFAATERFYRKLGFSTRYKSGHWLILERGGAMLEFFLFHEIDPAENNFGCCIRLDDLAAMVEQCVGAGIPESRTGIPRIVPPARDVSGLDIAYLVDPDGTLLRLVQQPAQ